MSAVDVTVMVLLTVLGILGLLICFAGHSFFKIGESCDIRRDSFKGRLLCNCNDVE